MAAFRASLSRIRRADRPGAPPFTFRRTAEQTLFPAPVQIAVLGHRMHFTPRTALPISYRTMWASVNPHREQKASIFFPTSDT
jgi:hypothetical protein